MGENAYRLLVEKPEGRRPLGRPRRRWADNITMDLVEVGWGGVDWIALAQDRDRWRALVNSELSFRVPYNAGKLSSVLTTGDLSSSAQLHRVHHPPLHRATTAVQMAVPVPEITDIPSYEEGS
jgi:hypothetical protein